MKKVKILIACLGIFLMVGNTLFGQAKSTLYMKCPGYQFTGLQYGISEDYPGTIELISGSGLDFELGGLFYFGDAKTSIIFPGIKATFINPGFIYRDISPSQELIGWSNTNIGSFMMQAGVGPVLTINPGAKILIDFYGQFRLALGSVDIYTGDADYSGSRINVMGRGVGGVSVSFNKAFISFEYNYGYITNDYVVNTTVIKEKVQLGYFNLGVGIKFTPFVRL